MDMLREIAVLNVDVLEKIRKKPCFLCDFQMHTKTLLLYLAEHNIRIEGILLPETKRTLRGSVYLNHRLCCVEDLPSNPGQYMLLDIFEESAKRTLRYTGHDTQALYQSLLCKKTALVYGNENVGRRAIYFLHLMGINAAWRGEISPDMQEEDIQYEASIRNSEIVLAISSEDENKVLEFAQHPVKRDWFVYRDRIFAPISEKAPVLCAGEMPIVSSVTLFFLIHQKNRKLVLYGTINDVQEAEKKLLCFGIRVAYAIDVDGFVGVAEDHTEFHDIWDLMYESHKTTLVWIVSQTAIQKSTEFIHISGCSEKLFCYCYGEASGLAVPTYVWCFDPNMGYQAYCGDKELTILTSNVEPDQSKKTVKVAILGGSTSDVRNFITESWPEILCEIAREQNISLEIFSGAVSGYISSQELVKLLRDIIPIQPDIVVSYSGINDCIPTSSLEENHFVHEYQAQLFEAISRIRMRSPAQERAFQNFQPVVKFGRGISNHAEHWLNQQRMMHAVCEEFGISFIGIAQPDLLVKSAWNKFDSELMECLLLHYPEEKLNKIRDNMVAFQQVIDKNASKYPWLLNFTRIFDETDIPIYVDHAHLFDEGNKVLAKRIFELIQQG